MTAEINACVPCGLAEPRRPTYFDGKLLLARDFEDEQAYHSYKRQLLNSTLHGTGTVCGLKVHQHPAADCRQRFAVIEPGLALDCCGQEIIVPQAVAIPVADLVAATDGLAAALDGTKDLAIALRRCDRPGELAPVILADCEGAAQGGRPGRVLEGFAFHLFAAAPGSLAPATHGHTPRLSWRHTLTFADAEPAALAFDDDAGQAYVAVTTAAAGEASRIFVYERRNQDLVTALDGPAGPIDVMVSPVGDQIYVAFASETGAGVAVYRKSEIRTRAAPLATIKLAGPVRIAVSSRTGALFALALADGVLTGWSQEAIDGWLTTATPADTGPADAATVTLKSWQPRAIDAFRGARLQPSADGRSLLIADDKAQPVRIVDTARLFGGEPPESADLLEASPGERPVAAAWSLDSRYVFLLSAADETGAGRAVLRRYEWREAEPALRPRGRGVAGGGEALDLAVAPGERWAYALVAREEAGRRELALLALDGERLKAAGEQPDPDAVAAEVALPGIGRMQRLTANGRQLYVAALDEGAARQPDRGLVAVVEPDEADCGERFTRAVDGCPACAVAGEHHVVVAHLPGYVAAAIPRIVDANPQAGEVAIDDTTYRLLVPSATTLKDIVDCILAEGIAEGPPGPRGDPGLRGPGLGSVAATALPAGAPPTATLAPIPGDPEGDLALVLGIPGGADGGAGPRGPGITDVAATTLAPGSAATATLSAIAGDPEGDFRLTLGIPSGAASETPTPVPTDLGHIAALSWRHGEPLADFAELARLLREPGLVIAFDRAVRADSLIQAPDERQRGHGRSFVFELLGRRTTRNAATCLCPLVVDCEVLRDVDIVDGVIRSATPADDAELVRAVRLTIKELPDDTDLSLLRVLLRCDFVIDEKGQAIDGNHLLGKLPTGDGVAGGLFESWLTNLKARS